MPLPPSPCRAGRTARRLEWQFLPPPVRAARRAALRIAGRRRPSSQGGGFTPGFASVLTCEDGTRHFVKAASVQGPAALRRRPTARRRASWPRLPDGVPAARLLWFVDERLGGARAGVRRGPGAASPVAAAPTWTAASTPSSR